jgi:hypothetical protein
MDALAGGEDARDYIRIASRESRSPESNSSELPSDYSCNITESIRKSADQLAELGYLVFVVDLFGAGIRLGSPQLPQAVVAPFLNDRSRFGRRLFAGLQTLQGRPECEANRLRQSEIVWEVAAYWNWHVPARPFEESLRCTAS